MSCCPSICSVAGKLKPIAHVALPEHLLKGDLGGEGGGGGGFSLCAPLHQAELHRQLNNRHPSCQEFRERSGPRGLSHAGWSSPQSLSRTDPCPCHMLLPHKSDTKDETAPSGCKFLLLPLCGLFGTWEACVFLGQRRYVPVLVFHIDRKPSASLTGHCRLAPTCILFLPLSTPGRVQECCRRGFNSHLYHRKGL